MEPITFFIDEERLKVIKAQFARSEDPGFTIINEFQLDGTELFGVTIFFSSSIQLWYFPISVQNEIDSNKKIAASFKWLDDELKRQREEFEQKRKKLTNNGLL